MPLSCLPRTSNERLAFAESTSTQAEATSLSAPSTVLYLAYGSNLNHRIMTEQKGVNPLSQVNVTAPSLRLVFDLPGLPYLEPCFANTAVRQLPKDPINPGPILPPIEDPKKPVWTKGLVGTVYEVTKEDYAKIMSKEGGGSGYVEIIVPCIALPPRISVPERPNPSVPRPFIAHTLFQPDIPDKVPDIPDLPDVPDVPGKPEKLGKPLAKWELQKFQLVEQTARDSYFTGNTQKDAENAAESDPSNSPKRGPLQKWWLRLVAPHKRPNPEYAQASARYLSLIVEGGLENELPDEYQAYLESFQPYTITTFRQKIGRLVMIVTALPIAVVLFTAAKHVSDKNGQFPTWLKIAFNVCFNVVWASYDYVLKPLFGDGERTISADTEWGSNTKKRLPKSFSDLEKGQYVNETVALLS
ncbi:hypothetical protein TD95_002814 [Thielaviopsis punctulata]|uniref:gamma-glutamylcyclotransferase n=1 Tax=Thielaviopsis punctulata TaxID=72032 RepID=A0A0F4ZHS8_9PEZI|nr:hypothetical protein TD95_002814 [Thielaviopsis punctulata]